MLLERGAGPYAWDADDRRYIDYIGSVGTGLLGHAHPAVVEAVREAAGNGFALGATHPLEVELGELIREAMPSIERLRFTSSGTEAAMSAVRLARAATGRDLVVKFAGAYHGHVGRAAGRGRLRAWQPSRIPGSAGVPAAVAAADHGPAVQRHPRAAASLCGPCGPQSQRSSRNPSWRTPASSPPAPGFLQRSAR